MMKRLLLSLFILITVFALSGCQAQAATTPAPSMKVVTPWVLPAAKGKNTIVAMTLQNNASKTDTLVKAESNVTTRIHFIVPNTVDQSSQTMEVDRLSIPANGQIDFRQTGTMLLMMGVSKDVQVGDQISLTLTFENSEPVTVIVNAVSPTIPQ